MTLPRSLIADARGVRVPGYPTQAYHFYRLRFDARSPSPGYWAVWPTADDGRSLRADIHSSVYAAPEWTPHDTMFRGLPEATHVALMFQSLGDAPLEIRDIEITPVSIAEARAWADALYSTLPPLSGFQLPPGHLSRIPRSINHLQSGEPVRVVMVGDSIMQDTCNSFFDILIEPMYPGADLQLIPSIDGGKGCEHYLKDAIFHSHIHDVRPDLLIVGTFSDRFETTALAALVQRIRAELDCDLLVLHGAGGEDHRFAPGDTSDDAREILEIKLPRRREFVSRQAAVCRELQVEFLDLFLPWIQYLDASGTPQNHFHRDAVHTNDRGKQIIARMLQHYFTPIDIPARPSAGDSPR